MSCQLGGLSYHESGTYESGNNTGWLGCLLFPG